MAKHNVTEHRDTGDSILARLKGAKVPAALKKPIAGFSAEHRAYCKAANAAEAARATRDAALAKLAATDAALDASLDALAVASVSVAAGTRNKPLAAFTRYAVTDLAALAYRKQADEVISMCAKIAASNPAKPLAAAAKKSNDLARDMKAKLEGYIKPQSDYGKALAARDALLPAWTKALTILRKHAAAAWAEDPAEYKRVFGAPDPLVAAKRRVRKTAKPSADQPAG